MFHSHRLACLAGMLAAALFASRAQADDWPVPRGPSREPKPYHYQAALVKDVPRPFLEDAPACILYSATSHVVEADGTVAATTHEVTRLNSRKGVEKLGEYHNIVFNPAYEKLTLNEAQVRKADGTVVAIEPRHVQLRDVSTDYQVYDQEKELVISFPNLQVGDVYEVRWTVRGRNPEFAGAFFTRYTFGDDNYPIVRDELHVRAPADRPLKFAAVNGTLEPTVTQANGQKDYTWRVNHRAELPHEEDRPSKEELRLQVAVSSFPTWDAVGRWKQKVRAECWHCTPDVKKTVAEVTQGLTTPTAKAQALTYWVRSHIRYLSRGPGGLGYTPHLPQQVLANLFGDCKDQAQLLAVMLREIGLSPWLVTLGTLDDGQVLEAVPSPWGTHAIVCVPIDGADHWIDTTITHAGWDFLPQGDRGRLAYLTREGELKLVRTPAFTYRDNRIEQTTHVAVQTDGTARCRRELTYFGSGAWTKRDAWLDASPGERRRLMTAELQDSHNKVKLRTLKLDEKNLLDYDAPLRAELEFDLPRLFVGTTVREGTLSDSAAWNRLLSYALDPERQLAFQISMPFESVHRFIVTVPLAYRADAAPEPKKVEGKWGFFRLRALPAQGDPRRLEFELTTRLERERVEPADFEAFLHFQEEITRGYRVWLSMSPTRDPDEVPLLEKFLAAQPQGDAPTAKVLAQLYLDSDRAAEARRVLDQAATRHPDDRALWELRVKATPDRAAQAALYQDMVRRFADEPKYALALGENCVQRGDYPAARKVLMPLTGRDDSTVRAAAQYQLARAAFLQDNPQHALRHLDASAANDGTVQGIEALSLKARIHERLGQSKEAYEAWRAVVQTNPTAQDALEALVRLEWKEGLKAPALDHLRRLTIAAEDDPTALLTAAELHWTMGRQEDALDLARRAQGLQASARADRLLGLLHLARHDYALAVAHLTRGPRDPEALTALIRAQLAVGDLDVAAHAARDSAELKAPIERLLARRAALLKRWSPAPAQKESATLVLNHLLCAEYALDANLPAAQVEKLLQMAETPNLPFGPLDALRGWRAVEKGQLRQAAAAADRAMSAAPWEPRAHLLRGRVRLERGQPGALADLEAAVQMTDHQDPLPLLWLAAAQRDLGQPEAAQKTQQQAFRLRPLDRLLQDQVRQIEHR